MTDKKQVDVLRQAHLVKVYNTMLTIVKQMLDDGVDAEMLASTLVAQGLRLYRGVLDQKGFDDAIESVVNNATSLSIKPLFEEKPKEQPKEDTVN